MVLLAFATVAAAQHGHPPAGHWAFDEGSGQTAYDSAGSNDGTLGNSEGSDKFDPAWTTGVINGALYFSGSYGDYVQVPHDASLNRNTITMSAWIRWKGEDPSDDIVIAKEGSYKMGLDKEDGELKAGINGGCPGSGWCDDGGNGWLYSGYEVPKKEWTHVAAVWDGTHINFYVDGERVRRHQPSEVTGHTPIVDTTRDVGIGARGVDARPHSFFYGKIDDVRIYEDPLTADDFQDGDQDDDGTADCRGRCSPTTVNIYNITKNTYNTENNYYNYTYNYDFDVYNITYNDYAYNTYNNYNYTFNSYEYNYYNRNYYNYTTVNRYESNTYNYENTYNEENTYIYYNFGDNCPEEGCEYVCQEPNCADRIEGDKQAPVLTNEVDLEIVEAAYPRRIGAGQEIRFHVTVRNQGELDADNVLLRVRAYGQRKELENLQVRSGRQNTFTVPFTVPKQASGPEDVQIEAVALNTQGNVMERDIATVPITVDDRRLTMQIQPQRVVVGDPVTIQGMMSQANMEAKLYVGGQYITTVRSDETKHYSHSVMTREPGMFRVELRSGAARKTGFIQVDPKIGVIDTNIPETVSTRDTFNACATVFRSTSGQATLTLLVDGQPVKSDTFVVRGEQQRCFSTLISQQGTHDVTFRVSADNVQDERTQQVNVMESRIEVNVFPQDITLQKGHSGVFQVELQNQDPNPRTFHIRVTGLSGIAETTQKQVALGSGESRTVFIRVVPPEAGRYDGTVTVTSEGATFADTGITVFANENPAMKGSLSRIGGTVRDVASVVRDNAATIAVVLGALALLVILGIVLYRRARRGGVIEPRY